MTFISVYGFSIKCIQDSASAFSTYFTKTSNTCVSGWWMMMEVDVQWNKNLRQSSQLSSQKWYRGKCSPRGLCRPPQDRRILATAMVAVSKTQKGLEWCIGQTLCWYREQTVQLVKQGVQARKRSCYLFEILMMEHTTCSRTTCGVDGYLTPEILPTGLGNAPIFIALTNRKVFGLNGAWKCLRPLWQRGWSTQKEKKVIRRRKANTTQVQKSYKCSHCTNIS